MKMRIAIPEAYEMEPLFNLHKVYAPEIVDAGMNFSRTTYAMSKLSLREFEGARMMVALINGCDLCRNTRAARDKKSDGPSVTHNGPAPDEALYDAVAEYRTAPNLSVREKLAIEYAEGIGRDPQGLAVDEDFWTRFKANYTDAEIVDLAFCVAVWTGVGRLTHVLGLDGICAIPALRDQAA